jgi:SAM-dependent methyltransferase
MKNISVGGDLMAGMPELLDLLKDISGGRLLDVATGGGRFIHTLLDSLKDYTEAVGIDAREVPPDAEDSVFKRENVHYQTMDAHATTFEDASFDTVTIANSLHHMADPLAVLAEMVRVLKPGGHLIINEMYCDHQTEAQMTHVHLHHWWGAVDTALGVTHNPTYTRQGLVDFAENLNLRNLRFFDHADLSDDPKDQEMLTFLREQNTRYLDRIKDSSDFTALQAQSEELLHRVETVGIQWATVLIAVGQK